LLLLFASNSDARTGNRAAGILIRGVDAPEGNTSRHIRQHEFLQEDEKAWQQFILTALEEMPKFKNEIPLDKLASLARFKFVSGSKTD